MTSRVSTTHPASDRSPPVRTLPTVTEKGKNVQPNDLRRGSLGFLRRSKSGEPLKSGGRAYRKMLKEQARVEELRRQREAAAIPKHAPRLPDLPPPPHLKTFGGEGARHANANAPGVPIPPIPGR